MDVSNKTTSSRNRILLDFLSSLIIVFLSLITGITNGIIITPIISGLTGSYNSVNVAVLGLTTLLLMIFISSVILIFLCLLNETFDGNKYSILFVNLLSLIYGHFIVESSYKRSSFAFFVFIILLYSLIIFVALLDMWG